LRCVNKISNSAIGIVFVLILTVGWWACRNKEKDSPTEVDPEPPVQLIEVQDAREKTISFKRSAIKVVSLVPSLTEYIFQIDKEHLLVGRSEWCRFPVEALDIKVAGGVDELDEATILAMRPDVVLMSKMMNEGAIESLELKEMKVVVFDQQNWISIQSDLEILGRIIDSTGDVKTLIGWMAGQQKSVNDQINESRPHEGVRTAVLYDLDNLYTAGPDTFVDEMINLAGGDNIANEEESQWPTLSLETLLGKQPEVIIIAIDAENPTTMSELVRNFSTSGNWSHLEAIRDNRVYMIDRDLLTIPGPRQILALRQIASAIHPDLFEKPVGLLQLDLLK